MDFICAFCGKKQEGTEKKCSECGMDKFIEHDRDPIFLIQGDIIASRYKIIDFLKAGGMGAVYKAEDMRLEKICAVKELINTSPGDDEKQKALMRFEREAKILSCLEHTNLPRVIDYFFTGNRNYLVMDFIDGKDLSGILEENRNQLLSEEEVVKWSLQICDILDYLHSRNPPVIYRDLKPSNIMIRTSDGKVMLVDFGIVRSIIPSEQKNLTETAIGTISYMSPEQYRGRADERSDIYSLGATIHHLLSGKEPLPFSMEPLIDIRPDISPQINAVVAKSLSMKPSQRFQSAMEMKKALMGYIKLPLVEDNGETFLQTGKDNDQNSEFFISSEYNKKKSNAGNIFSIPKVPSVFTGREKEKEKLLKKINQQNVIVIDGIAGTGKTAIALTIADVINATPLYNGNVCWINCSENRDGEGLIYEINRWLKYKKEFLFTPSLEDTETGLKEKIIYLLELLNKYSFIFFIDDYDKVKEPLSRIFIEQSVKYLKNSKIIIITDERPSVSNLTWFELYEQQLHCLDEENSFLLIEKFTDLYDVSYIFQEDTGYLINELLNFNESKVFEKEMIKEFYRLTFGHPFLIKNLFHIITSRNYTVRNIINNPAILWKTTERYVEALIKHLGNKEKELLSYLSLYRLPVDKEALPFEEDIDNLLFSLEKKFFINYHSENTVSVHNLLRYFCASNIIDKKIAHKKCASYYHKKINNSNEKRFLVAREAFYHYMQSEDIKNCVSIVENIMFDMIKYTLFDELIFYIDNIPHEYKTEKIILSHGKILIIQDKYSECLELLYTMEENEDNRRNINNLKAQCLLGLKNYQKAREITEINLKRKDLSLEYIITLIIVAEINMELHNYEDALKYIKKAFHINKDIKNQDIEIVLLKLMGIIEDRYGNIKEALKTHLKALTLAEETDNFKEIPSLKINIGWDYYQLGEMDLSLKFLKCGLHSSYTDSAGCHALYIMGLLFEEREDNENAINCFSKALAISKKIGNIEKQIVIVIALTEFYAKTGKYELAKEIAIENKYLIDNIRDCIKIDYLLMISEIYLLENNQTGAMEIIYEVLELCEGSGNYFQLFRARYIMSFLCRDKKDRLNWKTHAEEEFGKLSGNEKRKAGKYHSVLSIGENNVPGESKNYFVKINGKDYYTDISEVERIRNKKEIFDLFIDITDGVVWEKSKGPVDLTRKKNLSALLFHFVKNAGISFSIGDLYTSVWKGTFNKERDSITVRTSLSRLRKLLEPEEARYFKLRSIPYQSEGEYYFSEDVKFCLIEKEDF